MSVVGLTHTGEAPGSGITVTRVAAADWGWQTVEGRGTQSIRSAFTAAIYEFASHSRFSVPFGQQARLATPWAEQRAASTDAT